MEVCADGAAVGALAPAQMAKHVAQLDVHGAGKLEALSGTGKRGHTLAPIADMISIDTTNALPVRRQFGTARP